MDVDIKREFKGEVVFNKKTEVKLTEEKEGR